LRDPVRQRVGPVRRVLLIAEFNRLVNSARWRRPDAGVIGGVRSYRLADT